MHKRYVSILICLSACYGSPNESDPNAFTHPADAGQSGSTGSASTGGNGTAAKEMPAGFTIAWQINPKECLQPYTASSAATPLTTADCDGANNQRWIWVGGHYINLASGNCLDIQAPAGASSNVVVSPCNTSSTQYWFDNFAGQMYQVINGNELMVAPTSTATNAGVFFNLEPYEPPVANREWTFAVNLPQATAQTGFTMVPDNDPNKCLTGAGAVVNVQACGASVSEQQWVYDGVTFSQGDHCLNADPNGVITLQACNPNLVAQQWWLGTGDIVSGTSSGTPMCLFANPNTNAMKLVPNSTQNRGWSFGKTTLAY